MDNIELVLSIYSDNIESLIQIFNDSKDAIELKQIDYQFKIKSESITDKYFQEYVFYDFHFDWLLIQSLFISAFSHFESFMKSMALIVETNEGDKIKLIDIKGDGNLDTYRKYINLIGQINAASGNKKEWQTIKEFKLIRNAIVHENGAISKKLSKIDEHNLYFGPSKKHIRIMNIKFLEDFAKTSIDYMTKTAAEMRLKMKKL